MTRHFGERENHSKLFLPENSYTKAGQIYHPQHDVWRITTLTSSINYKFDDLQNIISEEIVFSLKNVMIWYLRTHSASHAYNVLSRFRNFCQFLREKNLSVSEITLAHILSYRSNLQRGREWYLSVLSGFMKHWCSMGYKGIHIDVPRFFIEARIKGNTKGSPVRTMDPETGPFDDIELQAIHDALNNKLSSRTISIEDFILVTLLAGLGVRPVQLAALKCKDLSVNVNEEGVKAYLLNVPRAKERSADLRGSFKTRSLTRETGEILESWIRRLRRIKPDAIDHGSIPIFPNWSSQGIPNFEYHSDSKGLGGRVQRVCKSLNLVSHRTGDSMKITARRFRYTLGTRAAQEGHGELVIAELLDHTDTQNVGVYVEATPEIAERIDQATALELAPIAQAFCGMIVESEQHAERGNDLTSRIGNSDLGNLGTCGKFGFCGAVAPVACYTCRSFQPWLDAPHDELLETLVHERERLLHETGDHRIASINDRTIVAVADVFRQCQNILQKPGDVRA